jgi:hypothetical protein
VHIYTDIAGINDNNGQVIGAKISSTFGYNLVCTSLM